MKVSILIILLGISLSAMSQTVLVEGIAIANSKDPGGVFIVRNDTIEKYQKRLPQYPRLVKSVEVAKLRDSLDRHRKGHKVLVADTNYVTRSSQHGRFRINAAINDTLTFRYMGFEQQKHSVKDLLDGGDILIQLEPEKCIEYVPCKDTTGKTYIFIGKKISVKSAPQTKYCDRFSMDSKFTAQYKILQNIDGQPSSDTISFSVYDHYGEPPFSHFQYALLFVTEYCGDMVHQKYQYFDVYPTRDGRWASPGDPYRFEHLKGSLKAEPIIFRQDVVFDVEGVVPHVISRNFPEPWNKLENGKVRPVNGAYVEDLVKIKKDGVLKARGIR